VTFDEYARPGIDLANELVPRPNLPLSTMIHAISYADQTSQLFHLQSFIYPFMQIKQMMRAVLLKWSARL
jgi:hypothetical protein